MVIDFLIDELIRSYYNTNFFNKMFKTFLLYENINIDQLYGIQSVWEKN